jgi:hypothetical protein
MGTIIGRTIMALCCTILLAATVHAKTTKEVYLKDGGIIECRKVWRADGKVMVLVNRDTLLDLSKDEVDLKKTFAKKTLKRHKKKALRVASKKPAAPMEEAAPIPAKPVPPPATPQKPKAATGPAAKAKKTAEKPVPPAPNPPPAPAAKPVPPPPAAKPEPPKPAVQHAVTSAKAPPPGAKVKPSGAPRSNLPLAKPATPPPPKEKSFLAGNMMNIALGALLVVLLIGYLLYKMKQKK